MHSSTAVNFVWGQKFIATQQQHQNIPNGEFASEPVEREAPNLYKFEAVMRRSKVALAPASLSVAFIVAMNSFRPAFLLTPA